MRFTTADITVSVDVATDLTVNAEGAVSLEAGAPLAYTLTEGALQQIQIEAVSVGEGTVTFTVGGTGQLTATAVVTVTVSTPTLMISASGVDKLEIEARTTEGLTVTVNVEAGEPNDVTLTATVLGTKNVASVTPEITNVDVVADTLAIFTVQGLDAGNATLRLMARHPDYKSTSIEVSVSVYLPPVGLSVTPPALEEIVIGTSEVLTITTATTATITISVAAEANDIINDVQGTQPLNKNDPDNKIEIEVMGLKTGRTTLTITAEEEGYTSETAIVSVMVLDPLRIEVVPATFDLTEGESRQISVSLNRIDADRDTVTVTINLEDPDGSGLTVSASSLMFTAAELQTTVRVTEMDDSFYTDPRIATLTLSAEAEGYTSVTVSVTITDDELPPVELLVTPPELEIVRGTEMVLTITTATTATITISEAAGADDIINDIQGTQTLNKNDPNNKIEIEVMGLKIGRTTLTITAEEEGYTSETAIVSVMVLDPLRIEADPVSLILTEGVGSTEISVSLNRIDAASGEVEVMIDSEGSGFSVSPTLLMFNSTGSQTVTVNVEDDRVYEDVRTGTVTLMATDYTSVTVTVAITDNDPRPPRIDLSVMPTVLNLMRYMSTEITVSVEVDSTLSVSAMGTVSLSDSDDHSLSLSGGTSTRITISANSVGPGTVTVTARAGTMQEQQTVSVRVNRPRLVISEVSPPVINNLVVGESEVVRMRVIIVVNGESSTLTATVTGTTDVAAVSPAEISLASGTLVQVGDPTEGIYMGTFTVEGLGAGDTIITLLAEHEDYESATTTVAVNVIENLRIVAEPDSFNLVPGASMQIDVKVNRVVPGAPPVSVAIKATEGLSVDPGALILSNTNVMEVTVTATDTYDGRATLTLTATGYSTATVTVNITDDEPQPIGLVVTSPPDLDLVTFASTEITVSVAVAATLNVVTTGSVRLEGGSMAGTFDLDAGETQIQIEAVSVGEGTVTFTVGEGGTADTAVVKVTVIKPSLVITGVSPSTINLLTRETTVVTVSVSAIGDRSSTLTAAVTETGNVASVDPTEMPNVPADMATMFTVTAGLVAGNETLTLMAENPDYVTASIEVPVNVSLRSIELSVDPSPLVIVSGMQRQLTVGVSADTDVTDVTLRVTVASGDENIISGFDPEYLLSGEMSTEITVIGGSTGTTTLMIEASAVGYATETTNVSVEVLDPLRIVVPATTFDLTEGENIQINVNPNLIRDDVTTVTISIEATTGTTGLTVSASSLEFTDPLTSQPVTVTARNDNAYTGDRNATLTLTATGYATETVTIRILDNDLVVTVTERDGESSISVDEGSDVELVINVNQSVPDRRDLNVNLSYTNITGTPETTSITVPAGSMSQDFSIPAGDDGIVAQATRTFNVLIEPDISSYVVGASSLVTVSVLNDDTATVTISPVSKMITGGDDAEFNVMLGLETAVNVEIGINVKSGGNFITDDDRGRTTVTVLAGERSTVLTVQTMENMGTAVNSTLVATLMAVPHPDLTIGDPSSASVVINALSPLSITATPTVLSLVEGGASAEINVSLNRIDADRGTVTVTIDPQTGSGLTVSESSLKFTTTRSQTVMVSARAVDGMYMAPRNETLTFAVIADDYAMATVTVKITDDVPQPIGLVVGSTELSLVAFETANITVSVEVDVSLTVETTGSVRFPGDLTSVTFDLDARETQIGIEAVSIGEGTVTFTASGTEAMQEIRTVSVMVSRSSLTISADEDKLMIETLGMAEFIVSVRAETGEPDDVTLTAMIDRTSMVAEARLGMTNVHANMTTATVTVTGLNVAGDTTLTLTASHPLYEPASIEVPVDVSLPAVELEVVPAALKIVSGMSAELAITATPTVTITIISDAAGIASVPASAARFELEGGMNNSTRINVSGDNIGDTTLTIEASADGHTTETAIVNVEVLAPLFIEAMPATFALTEGEGIQISVNPNLIRDDVTMVTISIEAPTGTTGLTVSPSSLEFTGTEMRTVTVTATNDNLYTGDRNATLRLTATGYATATVPIMILDNDLVVTVTRPDGESSIFEGSNVNLVINVEPSVPNRRDLDVNLSYTNITGTLETTSITVFAGSTEQSFSIPAGNDGIAAQSTRTFSVMIEEDSSYALGAPSSVAVPVLNDDSAVVSIFALSDRVDEGTPAKFEVQVSNEIAVTLAVTINLTTMGDFGIDLRSTDVEIAAGETTALLTVETADDDIDEDNGSLTATIAMNSLNPSEPIAGDRPTINTNPAMVTIEDDDLPVVVSITTLENEASTTISEADDEITLRLTLSRAIINQLLEVNLNSVGDSRLVAGAPSDVVVPASSMSQSFSISVDDDITAQATRTFSVTVGSGDGYVVGASPSVTVSVLNDDTAEVTISPVSEVITGGDDAEFNVILGLVTAVDVEIGIDVESGGDFITDDDRVRTTVTVLADQRSTVLTVRTMENTGAENSSLVATLVAVPHRDLTIGDPSSATVIINALGPLSIIATPVMLSLVEGGASKEISVSLNRIEAGREVTVTVTIDPQTGSGLRVSTTLLTFDSTESQTVTVEVENDTEYDDVRNRTLRFTANDYVTAMVMVEITDDELQPIGLMVRSPTDLDLVRFASTEITVSVAVDASLTIEAEGAVELVGSGPSTLTGGADATQIQIEAVSVGEGTVTFTVSGNRKETATEVVTVMVSTPSLVITRVPTNINLETMETMAFIVSVRAEAGVPNDVTLTATIDGTGVAEVRLGMTNVQADMTTATVTVTGLNVAGDTTLTLTASHPDYEPPESIEVPVNVSLRPIGLSVTPTDLNLVRFSTTDITVSVDVATDLTVKAEGAVRLEAGAPSTYSLTEGALSQQIQIEGDSVGEGTVTFTVSGAGQLTAMEIVRVMVSTPALVISDVSALAINLVARTTTGLTVRVSAEAGVPEGVTLTATVSGEAGRVVSVNPTERVIETVSVDTPAMFTVEGLDAGTAMLTLTAIHQDYISASTEVIVMVSLPGVELSVNPPSLRFEQEATGVLTIEVRASTEATITISSSPSDIVSVLSQPFTLMGGKINNSTMIEVSEVNIGRTILTITASADGYASETAIVNVEVQDRFRIETSPVSLNLMEGDGIEREISVSLSQIEAGREVTVTVTIDPQTGSGFSVSTSLLTFDSTGSQTVTVEVEDDSVYEDVRTGTVTFAANDYAMAMVTVEITDDEPQPIGLVVTSSTDLDLVRFSTADITVRVDIEATLNVETEGSVRLADGSTSDRSTIDAGETQIQILGDSVGEGTVIFTVGGGETADTAVVTVMVSKPTLMISASTSVLNIGADQTTAGLTVTVSAAGDPTGITLTAAVMTVTGTADVASVTPTGIIVSANTPTMFTVEGLATATGTTMLTLTLTASHPEYISAADTVIIVNVIRPTDALRFRIKVFLEGAQ